MINRCTCHKEPVSWKFQTFKKTNKQTKINKTSELRLYWIDLPWGWYHLHQGCQPEVWWVCCHDTECGRFFFFGHSRQKYNSLIVKCSLKLFDRVELTYEYISAIRKIWRTNKYLRIQCNIYFCDTWYADHVKAINSMRLIFRCY